MATKASRTPRAITATAWQMAENATRRLPRGRRARIVRVERGTVLVTQEGDVEDHVLEAGDEIVLRARGLAVAWAFTQARISTWRVVGFAAGFTRRTRPSGSRRPRQNQPVAP